ncbi:protein FAM110C [Pygocentrus nattereri]|uniref:protein FAM110C n=1 Tax=Pygocentrus nattereri TaxID=42514 RepID=UPI000814AD29|nr:protein FAM110C [Pygocentrus nattereri]
MLDTSRILQKGPEYLRKQMEREREATGRSAAERLAATKPEYIRNQRLLTSETVTNQGSPERSQQAPNSLPNITGEDPPQEVNVVKRNSSKKRPDSLLLYRHKGELQRGSQGGNGKKLTKQPLLASLEDKTSQQEFEKSDSEADNGQMLTKEAEGSESNHQNVARKLTAAVTSNREDVTRKPTTAVTTNREDVARKITATVTSNREDVARKPTATVEVKDAVWKPRTVDTSDQEDCKPATVVRSERSSRRSRVSRSHSDISSRYSRNFANFDAFFMYCGLDDDIIELMGRDNFCSGSEGMEEEFISSGIVRSVSVVASDDGFSQASSNRSDGLQEDELPDKKTGQGPSVIERNARVIKWLYSCRNATQSGKMLRDLD